MLSAAVSSAGGTISAHVRLEGPGEARLREVLFTGDFFVAPPRVIFDLESALRGVPVPALGQAVRDFFAGADVGLLSATPSDFAGALEAAFDGR